MVDRGRFGGWDAPGALQGERIAMFLNLLYRREWAQLNQTEAAELEFLHVDVRVTKAVLGESYRVQ